MRNLIPAALVLFLLTIAGGRIWARRSLALLTVEEKARAMELSVRGNVWPFVSLAAAFAILRWLPSGWIPGFYRPGLFALFLAIPFFVSLGAALGNSIRMSRARLPRLYQRRVHVQAIAFHVAVLVLVGIFVYEVYSFASQRGG